MTRLGLFLGSCLGLLVCLGPTGPATASFTSVSPKGNVVDYAGVLDVNAQSQLQSLVNEVEAKTTAEIAVVTVPSLEGTTIEEYANKLFKKYGIGKKGKDNGLLVLICPPERKMRIEVGYGLEGLINDGLAGQMIRQVFTPYFKEGDYSRGALAGVAQLARFIEGSESAPAWQAKNQPPVPEGQFLARLFRTLFFSIFVVIGLTAVGYGLSDKVAFLILWGVFFGGIPLVMAIGEDGSGSWSVGFLGTLALLAAGSGLWLGLRYPKAVKLAKKRSGNGWVWGATSTGTGSGFSGGGSSSGGGFGGGSSGGGGASGSW